MPSPPMRLQVGQNPFVNEYTDSDGIRKQQYDDYHSDESVGGCNLYILVTDNHNPTPRSPSVNPSMHSHQTLRWGLF